MPRRSEFVDYLVESLTPLGDVQARAMFGGWGFYLDGRMFALVAFETFYIKADDGNRADFESRGLGALPLRGQGQGKRDVLLPASQRRPRRSRAALRVGAPRIEAAARSAKKAPARAKRKRG